MSFSFNEIRANFANDNFLPLKTEGNYSSPEVTSFCSICAESGANLRPLAHQEMEILAKFVLNQEQISLISQTEDHPPIFCCKICSSVILSLAKLTTQIENITISLRAVISSRNGLFNKGRNDSKISEWSHEIAANNVSNASNNDVDQQLNEVEEEFTVKVEPIEDDDDDPCKITRDPLSLECEDSNLANSESAYVCKICQPNVPFTKKDHLVRHLKNKNIHPDVSHDAFPGLKPLLSGKFACKLCGTKFARDQDLLRHLRYIPIFPMTVRPHQKEQSESPVPVPRVGKPLPHQQTSSVTWN
ncbi:uncharacterized protein LOC110856619 isoform X1 [Folsomia candida]|uniref:uncharacterized protein LOC110856619 isoform X1 n=1 Tax=Folsomia candida TaxID=158441 RepID=UPI000B8FD67F|nr:uncharacterized protein LOC110856619 isoform X1 [Folsomia candida]